MHPRSLRTKARNAGLTPMRTARLVLPLLFVFLLALPVSQSFAAESSSGQAEDAVFEALQAGRRVPDPREYSIPERPTVFLTFDDGPSDHTPAVLDLLKEEGVPATFFVLGQNVAAHAEIIRRIAAEGHAIGNHTYDHVYDTLYGSFSEFWRQVQRTEKELEDKANVRTRLVRAPGGTYTNFDAAYFYLLERAGYVVYDWNVDSGDSKRRGVPAREIVSGATDLTTAKKSPNEVVVLLHDGSGHGETVKALPDIIRFYKEKGYVFGSLSPDVKPIQSSLGKPKWKRGYDYAQYGQWLAMAEEHAAVFAEREPAVAAQAADGASGGDARHASAAMLTPPLTLHFKEGELVWKGADYSLRNDRLYVPLRDLIEAMGGTVEWRDDSRVAIARYGANRVDYDLPHRAVTVYAPGKPAKRYVMAEMSLIGDKLVVPLRQAIERLGGEIGGYSFDAERRDVWIDASPDYGPAWTALQAFRGRADAPCRRAA
ncbi:polysaccharide deacetylase [Paenibacillus sp. GYB003]|uniref:polysaccharide deacetylase n=1 Tax=Paenibacillus sp. GYB003 TaxID=2994392 RepID=UPI002F968206